MALLIPGQKMKPGASNCVLVMPCCYWCRLLRTFSLSDISQGMHLNICLKIQLEGFLSDRGQVSMVDDNIQCNLRARFGLKT